MQRRFSREELYSAVWDRPLAHIGAELGVAGPVIADACRALSIPVPPRGYWLQNERSIYIPVLPPRPPGAPLDIYIGTKSADDDQAPLPPVPEFDEPLWAVGERARELLRAATVIHRDLSDPHPLVAELLAEDIRRKDNQRSAMPHNRALYAPFYESQDARRMLQLMSSLFTSLERTGFRPFRGRPDSPYIASTKFGAEVGGSIAEFSVSLGQPRRAPSGRALRGLIEVRVGPHEWEVSNAADVKAISEIAEAVIVLGEENFRAQAVEHQKRLTVERAARLDYLRREAERLAIKLAEENAAREAAETAAKRDRLLADAEAHRVAEGVRAYVRRVQAHASGGDAQGVEKWAEWALGVANEVDPMASGSYLKDVEPK